jgi:osmotically-inducible protein OsmY
MNFTNEQVIAAVRGTLASDPRLPYPDEIAVEAFGGSVALRGTVGSFAQQRAAVHDARRTRGVIDVLDELEVRFLNDDRREDAEIRGAVMQRLIWDPDIAADYLDIEVKDGWVTVRGEVDFQYQSDSAFERVERVRGVTGITNELKVVQPI